MYAFLFSHQLTIPIDEFENKKWFRCVYVNLKLKEEVSGVGCYCWPLLSVEGYPAAERVHCVCG